MPNPEPLYRWKWGSRGPYRKPYYIVACRWCYGTFEASRSDAVTGGFKCRRALSRYNGRLARGLSPESAARYASTLKRFSREGRTCASVDV